MRAFSILILAVTVVLSGCATNGVTEEAVTRELTTDIGDDEHSAVNRANAETLYNVARNFLEQGMPRKALKAYNKLQVRYPFSDYATQAALEAIYAHYAAHEYQSALAASTRFLKQHPRHPQVDYVYYLRGLAFAERTGGGGFFSGGRNQRDPTYLRRAFTAFNLLIQNYPDSPYVKDAQLRMIQIKHRLAKYELKVAEYYVSREAWVGANRRAEHIIEHYQGSNSVPRALEIMAFTYRKLGMEKLALDARAVLQESYPAYLTHREEFYRQRAGLAHRYELPPMDTQDVAPPASTLDAAGSDHKSS